MTKQTDALIARVKKHLLDTFSIDGTYVIHEDGVVDVTGDITVRPYARLTLVQFGLKFGTITGNFDCHGCHDLKTLSGAPTEVTGSFLCFGCSCLVNLEGGPITVGNYYDCHQCHNLKNLQGAPARVGGFFNINFCPNIKGISDFTTVCNSLYCLGAQFDLFFAQPIQTIRCSETLQKPTVAAFRMLLRNKTVLIVDGPVPWQQSIIAFVKTNNLLAAAEQFEQLYPGEPFLEATSDPLTVMPSL